MRIKAKVANVKERMGEQFGEFLSELKDKLLSFLKGLAVVAVVVAILTALVVSASVDEYFVNIKTPAQQFAQGTLVNDTYVVTATDNKSKVWLSDINGNTYEGTVRVAEGSEKFNWGSFKLACSHGAAVGYDTYVVSLDNGETFKA